MKTNHLFSEGFADAEISEDQFDFYLQNFYVPGPGDEEDDDEKDKDEDAANNPGNDDPPLDDEVVHSPLPTDPGGKPKK